MKAMNLDDSNTNTLAAVISRVQKLRRLATSPNPHEAASAAAKARELVARHRLDESQLWEPPESHVEILEWLRKRQDWWTEVRRIQEKAAREMAEHAAQAAKAEAAHRKRYPGVKKGGRP
jgi:hypothetical protein